MTNKDELAQLKQLATFMTERFSMNPVSCKILNEDWKKRFPDDDAVAETIAALLAERDADKKRIAELEGANASQDDHINQQQDRIDALEQRNSELGKYAGKLESISTAAEKLVRCKGRYHSEQNYRSLAALFGVKTPDLPPLETEARTVSVKLPESVIDTICLTAAEIHNLGRGVSDERAQEIINSIRCAAGIKLELGE